MKNKIQKARNFDTIGCVRNSSYLKKPVEFLEV